MANAALAAIALHHRVDRNSAAASCHGHVRATDLPPLPLGRAEARRRGALCGVDAGPARPAPILPRTGGFCGARERSAGTVARHGRREGSTHGPDALSRRRRCGFSPTRARAAVCPAEIEEMAMVSVPDRAGLRRLQDPKRARTSPVVHRRLGSETVSITLKLGQGVHHAQRITDPAVSSGTQACPPLAGGRPAR